MIATLDGRYQVGDEQNVSSALAVRLIERGYAMPVREPDIERAVIIAPEKAVKKRKRRRKRNVEPS